MTTGEVRIKRFGMLALVIVFVALGLRVWELGKPSLWSDEIMTEYRAQAPLWDSLENILKTIDQTPFFFMVLRLFPSDNEFLLRLPAALLGGFGVALLIGVARRLYSHDGIALWAGTWLAVNPYHVWLSRTARHYSLIFMLSLLISYGFLSLARGKATRRMWGLFLVSSMLGYLTHYSLLALPFTQLIVIVAQRRQRNVFARRWLVTQLVAAIPVAVWFGLMVLNAEAREPQWGERPWPGDLVLTVRNMTTGLDGVLRWYSVPGLAIVVGAVTLLLANWRRQPRDYAAANQYWLVLALVPMLLVFAVSLVAVNAYIDRYFMALLPGIVLLLAYGWHTASVFGSRWGKIGARAAAGCALFTGAVTVGVSFQENTLQREDWRGAAAYVTAQYQPEDVFVVDRAVTLTSLARYGHFLAAPRVIQLSETDEPIPPDEAGTRYWVVYRAPDEDIHQSGMLPVFDPFVAQPSVTSDWVMPRVQYVTAYQVFDGVTILLVEPDVTGTGM